jgi:ribosomal-protein-alanine N-acetyltransferase
LADLYREDRDFLRRWDPVRPEEFFTYAGQREAVAATLGECGDGRTWAGIIEYEGGPVGRVNLYNILRGPLRSCVLGYWVAQRVGGRGIATQAVAQALDTAFGALGLHRVDAFAREENAASCRVLDKNGFHRVGVSRGHIHLDGRWRDDIFFQRLAPWDDGVRLEPA